jgi:Ca2+-transporting ATPase
LYVAARLTIDESALIGKSDPSAKEIAALEQAQVRLGDRNNMAFMNTTVTQGYGVMIVIGTGMNTEFGRMMHPFNQPQPPQKPISQQQATTLEMATLAHGWAPIRG